MSNHNSFYSILTPGMLEEIHECALKILAEPGMRIENAALLKALKEKGAVVDFDNETAKIPKDMIIETIEAAKRDEEARLKEIKGTDEAEYKNQLTFSWHTPFRNRTPQVQASLGGGAPLYYDHKLKTNRYAKRDDFLRSIHLAEVLPQIKTVGNPVHYIKETDGSDVPPKMVAIQGAALIAKNSSKPGCSSIIDRRQLPYLMEIGRIIKGSADEYVRSPIFVNIHDTESPLRLTRPEAGIIEDMIKNKLCIFILPMPLMGISTPVYPVSAAIVAAAEILGVWTAVKAMDETVPVQASCVSGSLNPVTGCACFSSPECLQIDLLVAQLFRDSYGLQCSTGVGIIDSPIPGALSIYERTFKCLGSCLAGEPTFPVGLLGAGVVHSMEQVLLDLEIAEASAKISSGITQSQIDESLELIRGQGISGLHIDTDHTALNFKENIHIPGFMTKLKTTNVNEAILSDPVERAHNRCMELLSGVSPFILDDIRSKEIDKIVERASAELSSLSGATV